MSLNPYSWLGGPIDWCLRNLTTAVDGVGGLRTVGAFGIAIILVTLGIRVLLFPLYQWQLKTTRRIQAEQRLIAPQMQAIRKKYRTDRTTMQAEILKLYKEHGVSPLGQFAGCLPLLLQIPIIGGLYTGIQSATKEVTTHGFLWIDNLGESAKDAAGGGYVETLSHPWVLILPVVAAAATFIQSKITTVPPRPDMTEQERQMYSATKNIVVIMPAVILFMGLAFYQGIALYWVTQSIVMIAQQFYLLGWGGLAVPEWFPGHGYTPPLSYAASTQTTLSALGARHPEKPLVTPKRVGGNRPLTAGGRRGDDGAAAGAPGARPASRGPAGRPAARRGGRVSPTAAGGGRRKRAR